MLFEHDLRISQVKRFGSGKWAQILQEFPFEGRTGVNLKDKYRNLVKKGEIA